MQLLETLSVDCDTEIISWTVNSPDYEKQGRIHAVSLGDHVMLIVSSVYSGLAEIFVRYNFCNNFKYNFCVGYSQIVRMKSYTVYVVYLLVILIWQFGESLEDRQINCTPLSSHSWISFYTVLKCTNLKSHQFKQIAKYSTPQ